MTNDQIAKTLEELADLLEIQGADSFRLRAYRSAAEAIADIAESLSDLVLANVDLTTIPGIGKGVAQKCKELIETGSLQQLEEVRQEVPSTVLELLRIPKLGPKKVATLHRELGINSLAELKAACEAGRVRQVSGFTAKTEQSILAGMELAIAAGHSIYWSTADEIVREFRDYFRDGPAIQNLEFAGSYRRGKDTIEELVLLVVSETPEAVLDHGAKFPHVKDITQRDSSGMTARLDSGIEIVIQFSTAEAFGAALQLATGSATHITQLAERAAQQGTKITAHGVMRMASGKETYAGGRSEDEVYRALGLPLIPPELREGRRELAWAESNALPQLVTLSDIRGDLHMHTTASDGTASIREMVAAAHSRGLQYIAITDHSKRVSLARGLDAARLREQWKEIDRINAELVDFQIFKGVECDILENGDMDLADDVLAEADWVLASVHYGQNQPAEQITRRILNAIENPHVDIIAHPTGRLLNRRKAYAVNFEEVFAAAVAHKKKLELNANPARLDLHDEHCARARELGIPIVINSDAHSPHGLDVMRYGVIQARRGGLTPAQIFNCLDMIRMRQALRGE